MTTRMIHLPKQKGLTLTELMVDLLISAFIIGAVVSLYTNYKKDETIQFNKILISNNAIAAFKQIKNDIQLTGFYGCNSSKEDIEFAFTPSFDEQITNAITANEATNTGLGQSFNLGSPSTGWSPTFQGQASEISPDSGSDVITVRYAQTNPNAILQTPTTGNTLEIDTPQTEITEGETLLISDCIRTVLFKVDSYQNNTITPTQSIGSFNAYAEIYKININTYYVKTVDSLPALYKYSNSTEELLVPNVENMQIMYGQDTDGDNVTDIFRTANQLSNNNIKNIEISLLIKSSSSNKQMVLPTQFKFLKSPSEINTTITATAPNDYYDRQTFDFGFYLPNG